jgi:hypothetical protein
MATSFYVYYRVADDAQALAQQRVAALLEHLRIHSGVRGRLMKKLGERDLWMEVYDGVADPARFEALLISGARELALDEVLMQGWSRRVECFED